MGRHLFRKIEADEKLNSEIEFRKIEADVIRSRES